MLCATCRYGYHFGGQCAGIAEKTYRSMSTAKKQEWVCKTCRAGEVRTAPNKPIESAETEASILVKVMQELTSLRESVATLLVLPAKVDELKSLKVTVESLLPVKRTVDEIKESVSFLSEKYDQLLSDLHKNDKELKELKPKLCALEAKVAEQEGDQKATYRGKFRGAIQ